jgi:oligopeptide transport system ATP-binding protein
MLGQDGPDAKEGRMTADPAAAPLLEVRSLSRRFGGGSFLSRRPQLVAVDRVSLEVRRGESLGIVGESGCGKSTLGRLIVQLLAASAGEIRYAGDSVTNLRGRALTAYRRQVQMVFQDPYASLNPRMNVGEIVREPLRNFGIATGEPARRRVRDVLERCGLSEDILDRYPHEFSGGQRQRIGIARALVIEPELVVADEPISALDVSIQAQIVNLFKDLQAELGLTYLFIAHDLSVVRYFTSRVAVMYLGQIVEIGATDDVYGRVAHPYTWVLLNSVPLLDPQEERERQFGGLEGELPSPLAPPSGCRFHTRCPWAEKPLCSTVEPPLVDLGNGHSAACHFAGGLPLDRRPG